MNLHKQRSILRAIIRDYFSSRDYLEIDTPAVVELPGVEVHLDFFATDYLQIDGTSIRRYLRTSPEVQMKRVIAEGVPRIFQIGPCFRNRGEFSDWHHPEFTMLEWYAANEDFQELMNFTESFLLESAKIFNDKIGRLNRIVPTSVEKIKVGDIFFKSTGVKLNPDDPEFAEQLIKAGCASVNLSDDSETAFFKAMFDRVGPYLKKIPLCMLMDYPISTGALARVEDGVAKRFEVYASGVELCNGFSELIGESENRQRHAEVSQRRVSLGKEPLPVDEEFFLAMGKVSPLLSSNALGFDRWLAILLDLNLNQVIPLRAMVL